MTDTTLSTPEELENESIERKIDIIESVLLTAGRAGLLYGIYSLYSTACNALMCKDNYNAPCTVGLIAVSAAACYAMYQEGNFKGRA